MELAKLEKLLDKYFEGETTLSEEKELKVYFTGESVPSHLEKYKDLFQFFSEESQVTASSEISLNTSTSRVPWYTWIGVAASIALIVGLFIKDIPAGVDPEGVYGTYDDPELALQKTKEALDLVASLMNEGKKDLVYLNEFDTAKKELVYLNEFETAKNKLIK
ncbi:hypothetical protein D1815_08700 [Aquimarina sp. AD1]|uniref:hypothetical protein n=1 Tax=Aquimarina sp. (strain AD1) TaxID=1714848 RepID=UPI000E4E8DF5|nr:hypothetical protein [Aquimarina sp. AD1]AXT55823.1 hypothetical protein D1815_08700 [Aquimarina sp. AD1]RKN29751.1 hypothetical protein D7035_06875 [Aquimarina sp. AD1]